MRVILNVKIAMRAKDGNIDIEKLMQDALDEIAEEEKELNPNKQFIRLRKINYGTLKRALKNTTD